MKQTKGDNRKVLIYNNWLETGNMALTGRNYGVTREYVRQVIEQLRKEASQV